MLIMVIFYLEKDIRRKIAINRKLVTKNEGGSL